MTRRRLAGCALALVAGWLALWVGYLWLTGYFDGWNVLRGVRGVVVDGRTGRPVGGGRVWWWWLKDEVGLMRASPGGYNQGYPVDGREARVGEDGSFAFPGYLGLQAVTGGGVAVLVPGYQAAISEGRFPYSPYAEVRWRVRRWRVEVEVRLRPLYRWDPPAWEEHLRRLDVASSFGNPLPRDLLLDEAYRYVSGGGELTEGILAVIAEELPGGTWDNPSHHDRRRIALAKAVLSYCGARPESKACRRIPGTLAELPGIVRDFEEGQR